MMARFNSIYVFFGFVLFSCWFAQCVSFVLFNLV